MVANESMICVFMVEIRCLDAFAGIFFVREIFMTCRQRDKVKILKLVWNICALNLLLKCKLSFCELYLISNDSVNPFLGSLSIS
jgi:hypothetical protein